MFYKVSARFMPAIKLSEVDSTGRSKMECAQFVRADSPQQAAERALAMWGSTESWTVSREEHVLVDDGNLVTEFVVRYQLAILGPEEQAQLRLKKA